LEKDIQYYKFCAYGFLRNLRFFEAFLILFLLQKGMSYTSIGILYALREVSANILEIPSGIAADVLGRKKTLAASFLAYIFSFLILYLFQSFILIIIGFLLYGAGEAFRSGTHKGMIADYLKSTGRKEQMILYYGHTRSWSQNGLAVSSLIAGFIVFYSGSYNSIFLFSTIPYILNLILGVSYPAFLDKSGHLLKGQKRQEVKRVISDSINTLKNRKVLNLINITALHTAYLKAMKDYLQPMLVSLILLLPLLTDKSNEQRSAVLIGIIYFFIFILTSIASNSAGKLAASSMKKIPEYTLAAGLISGVLSGILYLRGFNYGAVFFFICIYIIENLRKPVLTGYVSENVDNSILTSVLSVQSQLKTIFTAIIALSFGIIADFAGIGWSLVSISLSLMFFSFIINIISSVKRL
jgi:MFS family permease